MESSEKLTKSQQIFQLLVALMMGAISIIGDTILLLFLACLLLLPVAGFLLISLTIIDMIKSML